MSSPRVQSAPSRTVQSKLKQHSIMAGMIKNKDAEDSFASLDHKETAGEMLLDINRVIPTVLQKLKKVTTGNMIEVKTYKRDRGFRIEKRPDGKVLIQEYGFNNQEMIVTTDKLKKTLKTVLKTEFPRSKKVWIRIRKIENKEDIGR